MLISKIRRIKLKQPIPVYDITSPKYHNFALSNGVIVHNTAKQARNPQFQEVLALGGKPLNVYGGQSAKAGLNERILDILRSIGYDPKSKDPVQTLRVGKIILLADPDVDGAHITNLLLSILHKMIPKVFEMKMVYIVDSMLFMAQVKGKYIFGKSLEDLKNKVPPNTYITRIKGWGEVNADQLGPAAFDPKTRKLINIEPASGVKENKRFVRVVGETPELRKELLGVI